MSLLERIAVFVLGAAIHIGAGYWWGTSSANARHQAAQAKANAAALAKVRAAEAEGDRAVAAYVSEHFDQEARYAQLEQANRAMARTVGLLSGPSGAAAAGGNSRPVCPTGPAGVDPAEPPGTGPALAVAGGPQLSQALAPGAGPELSLRALWLWNSALGGRDMPAGTCGLSAAPGAADAACAAGAGVGLEDAWANHSTNARSCAADRARYAALITLLRSRGLVEGTAP